MTDLICPIKGCNNKDIQIYVHDWDLYKPATVIEINCPKCGAELIYNLKLAQDSLLDRIDET